MYIAVVNLVATLVKLVGNEQQVSPAIFVALQRSFSHASLTMKQASFASSSIHGGGNGGRRYEQ